MTLEIAMLQVKPGQTAAFEAAFAQARSSIEAIEGFEGLELQRCVENDPQYALLGRWRSLEDHTVEFRQSEHDLRWKSLLHHFYDPFPTVLHDQVVTLLA